MIPDYQTLMRPVLESARPGPRKIGDVVDEITDRLGLDAEDRQRRLPSGKQTVIANRVHWARTYLKQAGLVRNTKRGWFELTELGRQALESDARIDTAYLSQFDAFNAFKTRSRSDTVDGTPPEGPAAPEADSDDTPDESLLAAHARLEETLSAALLENVRQASPAFFEQLIVDLLLAMGYGGSTEDAGRALGRTGDNGVDGVIDQDPLGVDQIYLQAKRYGPGNAVGAGEIRDFFGALNIRKATKGIFVTTSDFTAWARQTTRDLGSRIVLIDGAQLARLMIAHDVGCRDRTVLHIKQIDEAYFDEGLA
ncbi:restriction endonuclease [Pseudoponticoccus marisrubri]|uniref:Restriction endonuclease n=1 Tax=Pseudoponticoccus marisrubri TaxID=1685382 RepID=A0A0W7WHP8_9RHOB|nr:restriction endonuclease [Pseudoponticoccus marisrubri]KUF10147.1 restriction endonuclease [Pseudoponticoccus marisrubri]